MNIPAILDNIINLFNPKGESVLGVDIGSSSIKIVQARNKGGHAVLETYGEVALGPYGGTDIGRAVKLQSAALETALLDVWKESNATTKVCGVAIPLTSSLITTMKVPRITDTNLEEVVSMEARRFIPVSMSEITLDWQIIPDDENDSTSKAIAGENQEGITDVNMDMADKISDQIKSASVLIVAVHTETIDKLKDSTEKAGMNCKFFELEAFSTIRAVLERGRKTTVAVVDFGASSTKVYIVDGGIIKISHTIPFGSQDITLAIARGSGLPVSQAESLKRKEGIPAEINGIKLGKLMEGSVSFTVNEAIKVIKDYQMHSSSLVNDVVLTGGGVSLKGFPELFGEKISMNVKVADPFSNLVAPAFLGGVLKSIGPTFSVAIGAVIRALAEGH